MSNESRATPSVLDQVLCIALAVGLVLVALLPAARGMSAIGWMPMWLVAMPALAWWSLHGFAMPVPVRIEARMGAAVQPRRSQPQARRHARAVRRPESRRAA